MLTVLDHHRSSHRREHHMNTDFQTRTVIYDVTFDACIDFDPEGGFNVTVCRSMTSGISGPFGTYKLDPVTDAIEDIINDANLVLLDNGYISTEKWRVHQNGIVWSDLVSIH